MAFSFSLHWEDFFFLFDVFSIAGRGMYIAGREMYIAGRGMQIAGPEMEIIYNIEKHEKV